MALVAYAVGLVVIWVLAWGSPTPANILGGLGVAALLLVVSPDGRPHGRIRVRPLALARFVGFVLLSVVQSNVEITREVLSRESRITTGVVAVPLPDCSDGLLTLITNVMALTPGTMPIEVRQHPTVMYIHVLHLGDVEEARREVQHLARLAYHAFGSDEAVAALDRELVPDDAEEAR
jgi:multicomponent Na+:H+ antiporter subunit E